MCGVSVCEGKTREDHVFSLFSPCPPVKTLSHVSHYKKAKRFLFRLEKNEKNRSSRSLLCVLADFLLFHKALLFLKKKWCCLGLFMLFFYVLFRHVYTGI